MAVLLSLGSEPELLLLRSQVLEKSGHSVITVSNLQYAIPVFHSTRFDGVIFCHMVPVDVRNNLVSQMLSNSHRSVPTLVFRKPVAPGDDAALTVVGTNTQAADALCQQLLQNFRLSGSVKRHSLQSWKEVAAYVGRGVRTVQRWESFGLPVHRPSGHDKGAVFVLVAELDEWMRSAHTRVNGETQGTGESFSNELAAPSFG